MSKNKTISISDEIYSELSQEVNASQLIEALLRKYYDSNLERQTKVKDIDNEINNYNSRLRELEDEKETIANDLRNQQIIEEQESNKIKEKIDYKRKIGYETFKDFVGREMTQEESDNYIKDSDRVGIVTWIKENIPDA